MKYFGALMKCNTTAGYYYHKLGSGFVTSVYDKDFPKMKINYQRNLLVFFPDKPKNEHLWELEMEHYSSAYIILLFNFYICIRLCDKDLQVYVWYRT